MYFTISDSQKSSGRLPAQEALDQNSAALRVAMDVGQLGLHGVGQGGRKWPDPIPTDGETEAHSGRVTSPE